MKEESELERLAAEEILLEAKRGLARANEFGASGWKPCPLPGTNKKFLHNTIRHVVSSNKLKEQKYERKLKNDKHILRQEYAPSSHRKMGGRNTKVKDGRKYIHNSRKEIEKQEKKNISDEHLKSSDRK